MNLNCGATVVARKWCEVDMIYLDVVPITKYCEEMGETLDAVNKRLQRGVWQEGVHVLKVDGSKERWIDLKEIANWARQNKDLYLSQEV